MFVYCLNNPLYYADSTGELAYPGEIHNAVVNHIKTLYGLYREQKIAYSAWYKGRRSGRADLISANGDVWEVKRDRPWHIAAGMDQVKNYVANTWINFPQMKLRIGGYIEQGSFLHKSNAIMYKVTYRYAGYGVIAYDYDPVDVDLNINIDLNASVTMGMGAALGMACCFSLIYLPNNSFYMLR